MIMTQKYIDKKLKDIEAEICLAVAVANMIGCMTGKCTDSVIEIRDNTVKKVQKIVIKLLRFRE